MSFAYDAANRLSSVTDWNSNATSYSYDDANRMTTTTLPSGSDTFSWDYEDRMASATVNSVTTSFAYRGDGLRNSRTTGGNTTTFTWDIAGGLPVVLDDGSQYVYAAGLTAMKQSGSWFYYLADGLGSTMALLDSAGAVQKGYTYDVYGRPTATGSLANEFDFAGQQTDATGLQYLRARYMDPATGTFASREPMAILPGWAGNPFGYAAGNPARFIDSSGLQPIDESGCALTDAGCQERTKREADENSVCDGLYYYQWHFCRDKLGDESFGHWKATLIAGIVRNTPFVGEYFHKELKVCAENEDCRVVLEFLAGDPSSNIAMAPWLKSVQYAKYAKIVNIAAVTGSQVPLAYLTLYHSD